MSKQKSTLNQADIELLQKHFLTKEDGKVFATKNDLKNSLKNVVTKDDAKTFATKYDLNNFATKDDIKELRKENKRNTAKVIKNIKLYTGLLDDRISENRDSIKKVKSHLGLATI